MFAVRDTLTRHTKGMTSSTAVAEVSELHAAQATFTDGARTLLLLLVWHRPRSVERSDDQRLGDFWHFLH